MRHVLWGNLLAGGSGVEAYFGYAHPQADITAEDWRSRDGWWRLCAHALGASVSGEREGTACVRAHLALGKAKVTTS